jgi:arsenate reductase (thioredoxin)
VTEKKRVLFVCIGNACRSQMAEAFARTYGSDVLIPASAGLAPAMGLAPDTMRAMAEKNIDLRDQFPKSLRQLERARFDLAVNMSGYSLPEIAAEQVEEWDVPDPVSMEFDDHCAIRDKIERLVMELVLRLRADLNQPRFRGHGSGRLQV